MARSNYLTSPPKISTMPPGVPYIVGNEAAERFSYYGMNSILTIFMTKYLLDKMGHLSTMPAANAEAWYHTFVSVFVRFCRSSERCWPTLSSGSFGSSSGFRLSIAPDTRFWR